MQSASVDTGLLARFDAEVLAKVPHVEEGRVVQPTPLVDVTDELIECGKAEYGLGISKTGVRVFAKFDSKVEGGSVKVRPAVAIVRDAIATGRLVKGQTVFEATSGNFGLALAGIGRLGLDVVALVSRRLQQGVIDQLQRDGVKLVNLDVDVCPAPGLKGAADALTAKSVAASVGQQLKQLGFDAVPFDGVREEAEGLLARQDAIGLAKLLARAYGGFCPEQYDNDRNVEVHRTVTGPELEEQLRQAGSSLREADFVCTFGTGGTALGVGNYIYSKHGRKGVRVVFPLAGQDVAGIRTKEKAMGLKFYEPEAYVGEHEVDFEEASRVFEFFNRKGYDIGESGALALYACMELVNYGAGKNFVVMVADGASKYISEVKAVARKGKRDQVRLEEAASVIGEYGSVVWAHNMFVPREEGVRVIASSLGCPEDAIRVADVRDVQAVLNGGEPSEEFERLLPADDRPMLIVCLGGNTSLMLAKVLERKGVAAESLVGGITGLPASRGKQPFDLVQMARP
ncbi:MAG: pyridoxal-phosphate dependent enzyme [Nitrososphaerota archaeon]|nr:pyridoxal-phosphate dependent enzyme [Nitrososphaerota archaeon]MDG7024835.1 pyridoxal-phosphate dependent enzyme [Nitrososphaerota archaeon]